MKALQPNLNREDKELMEKLLADGHLQDKYAVRLRTVLLRAKGKGAGEISEFLGIHQATVSSHSKRYISYGVNALLPDKTRKPGKQPVSQDLNNEMCSLVGNEKPPGETHGSCRTVAKRVGIGHAAVSLILRELGLRPPMW